MNFEDYMKYFGIEQGCDIPGGFQDMDPQLFILIAELIGNIMAGELPFNIQNAIGNWLQLVGQAIETYNAQQQYFQSGPGRYYNRQNKNVSNPFCSTNNDESSSDGESQQQEGNGEKEIAELKNQVLRLCDEINILKEKINNIEKDIL